MKSSEVAAARTASLSLVKIGPGVAAGAKTPVAYLDAPEFQKYWERDAARLKVALEKIGKVEEK